MNEFIEQIISNLNSNGFPEKRVSLPMEKMYEIADQKGLSLNAVLEDMRATKGIDSSIETEKIIFSQAPQMDASMMANIQEMMAKMDPEELKNIQEQVQSMAPEKRDELLNQAKGMGLF